MDEPAEIDEVAEDFVEPEVEEEIDIKEKRRE